MFRCISCGKRYLRKFRPDHDYEVVMVGDDGWQKSVKMCQPCGEKVDETYEANKSKLDVAFKEEP